MDILTKEQVCKKFNVSESSLVTNFKRTQASILKKYDCKIERRGTDYLLLENDKRAASLFKEQKEAMIEQKSIKFVEFDFVVLLGIIMTPMQVFRGSYDDFLKYVEMRATAANKEKLRQALDALAAADYINYTIDKTDDNYFFAGIYHKVEEELKIGVDMIVRCKQMAKRYRKKSWVPLLKTWLGIQILYYTQPYTVRELCDITGLSEYNARSCIKILEDEDITFSKLVYAAPDMCLGREVAINGIWNKQI